jgi:hypothetical protein
MFLSNPQVWYQPNGESVDILHHPRPPRNKPFWFRLFDMDRNANCLPLPLAPSLVGKELRRLLTLRQKDPSAYDQAMKRLLPVLMVLYFCCCPQQKGGACPVVRAVL